MSILSKLAVPRLAVRGIQVFFSLMVITLSSYVANWYNTSTLVAAPPQINVMIVSAILSLLSVAVIELLPKFVPSITNPYIFLAIESTNCLFHLSSGIALTVFLSRLLFCRGGVCAAAQADAVFSYIMFLAWLATLVPLAMGIVRGGGAKGAAGRRISTAGVQPAMTWGSTASVASLAKGKDEKLEDV